MSRKIIGIPGYRSSNNDNFGAGITHLEFLSKFGDVRIIMPWEEKVNVNLLYLPGGLDVSPSKYGQVPSYRTSNQDVFKEFFYEKRLDNYINDTPIFGVCLGMQMLATKFGSVLTQDFIYHEQSSGRYETAHEIYKAVDTFGNIVKKSKASFKVNSHHHQGVTLNGLSNELDPLYVAENEDAFITGELPIVEAFTHKSLPIVGVQWHPEELYDPFSLSQIEKLLK